MSTSWKHGLVLAALLAVVGTAAAQPGGFRKPGDAGRGGEAERLRDEMKNVEGQIKRLQSQIENLNRQLQQADGAGRKAGDEKKKFGPPEFQGKFGGFPGKKGPPEGKGRPDGKGRQEWAEMWKKAIEEKMRAAREGRFDGKKDEKKDGKSPWAEMWKKRMEDMRSQGPGRFGPPGGRPDFGRPGFGRPGFGGPGYGRPGSGPGRSDGPPRPDARRDADRPSGDLESRVNRLERAIEELRREIRSSRR